MPSIGFINVYTWNILVIHWFTHILFYMLRVGLKTDGNIPVLTRSVFYFCPSVSVFVGFRFRIYGSGNEVSPSVSEKSRFYMELIRIYSIFHPVFNLHKICLKINMFKNIPITKYVC